MSHLPANHSLRGLYRTLAFLTGVAAVVYGAVGYFSTRDSEFFHREPERVWGVTTNPAFAVTLVGLGVLVLIGVVIGRNVDVTMNIVLGSVFIAIALVMLCLIRTDINVLAFSITNVNVSFIAGTVLITAGMYSATHPAPKLPEGKRN